MRTTGGASQRIDAVRRGLATRGAAVAVFGLSSHLRYLTGFTDEPGERMLLLVVPRDDEAVMLVPALYANQVEEHGPPARLRVWADGEDPQLLLREIAAGVKRSKGQVLLDDSLWATFALRVQEAFSGRSFGLASEVMAPLREKKDASELEAMRRAGDVADAAFAVVTAGSIRGLREIQLAGRLEEAMLHAGADGIAFETLVASGPNSALPHYRAGSRRIEPRDVVILDYGCRVDGYCSDITRTVVCGEARAEVRAAHDAVVKAHWAARESAVVGVAAEVVDAAARDVLCAAGYGAEFVHRTGHGIGLDVHEPPYIVKGNRRGLEDGMTFSIEPGAYFRGDFGIRVEDVVAVRKEGAEGMTRAPQGLLCIE